MTVPGIILAVIACLSFMAHLFFYTVSATVYLAVLAALTFCYVLFKPLTIARRNIILLLIMTATAMFSSYLRSNRLTGSLMDVMVLFLGTLLVIFHTRRISDYQGVMHVISFFALFFAVGTLLHALTPTIHSAVLSLLPSSYAAVVRRQSANFITGFTTNPGFSAGYMTSGIIVSIAACQNNRSALKNQSVSLIILVSAFMLTGKRGPAIFLVMTLILCYLMPMRGAQRAKRYWRVFLVLLVLLILFLLLRDFLITIPIFEQISMTVSGILTGDDVSSGRTKLYIWAIRLFLRHPWLGIGWGNYKTTVVGNATLIKELDTHNIYLQLLCETGIVGFVIIVGTMLLMWNMTRRHFKQCVASPIAEIRAMLPYIYFSFAYQTCFLLYGLTGNALYDQHFQIIYMMACAMMMTYQYRCGLIAQAQSSPSEILAMPSASELLTDEDAENDL